MKTNILMAALISGCALIHIHANAQPIASTTKQQHNVPNTKIAFVAQGTIAEIEDGDTIKFKASNGSKFTIRMSDIDTPEIFHKGGVDPSCLCKKLEDRPGQKYGKLATQSLEQLAPIGASARAECYEADQYGRLVCHVYIDSLNLNLEQLKRGWAMTPDKAEWIRDPESIPSQEYAKSKKYGVWQDSSPIPPSEWRKKCWGEHICPNPEN